jgi:putative RecB family exonuclease
LRTIDAIPEEPSPAAIRGTLIHRVLELLFSCDPKDRTLDQAHVLVDKTFADMKSTATNDADLLQAAGIGPESSMALVKNYFDMEDPRRISVGHCELGIAAHIDSDFTIRGFVDRVDISLDNQIRIVDYKTGRSPGPRHEHTAMFQMRFYALTWWRSSGSLPKVLQLLYLGNRDRLLYEPDEADLLSTERKILAIRDAIKASAKNGDFKPAPSRLCQWCSFQALCPAFDGTPPPLPDPTMWNAGSLDEATQSTMLKNPST